MWYLIESLSQNTKTRRGDIPLGAFECYAKLNAHSLGVALKHMHLEIGVHTLQARSQAFSDQAIIGYRHKGGTRTRNPQRSRTTIQANLPHLIVIGNKFTAIGFLDFVVAGGSDKTNVAPTPNRA